MTDNRNTCNNEDFIYMWKLLCKYGIYLELSNSNSIILGKVKGSFQSVETISEILNNRIEITEENKNNRWICYNDMVVFSSVWEHFKEEFVFGNPIKAIINYCENIDKEQVEYKGPSYKNLPESVRIMIEIQEKMTKAGLALTPEQENTLLQNAVNELSAEIARLELIIKDMS